MCFVSLSRTFCGFYTLLKGSSCRFTPARTLRAEAEEKGGMWDKEKGSDDSEEEDDDDDDDEEEESSEESSDEDDAAPRSKVTFAQAGPSTSSSSAAATRAQTSSLPSTTAGPSSSRTNSTGVDKFGNAPELTKREAKKAAQAAKAQAGSDESSSEEDDDPLLNAGKANSSLSKQMKASSLGKSDGTKAPSAAPTGMNRKERWDHFVSCSQRTFKQKRDSHSLFAMHREEAAKKAAREKYLEVSFAH